MCADVIVQLAARARQDPQALMRELGALAPGDREGLLYVVQTQYATQSFRPYTPHVTQAILQLVANEFVATPEERNWQPFYKSRDKAGNGFLQRYQQIWKAAAEVGEDRYFAQPDMLTYVLQTVTRPKTEIPPVRGAALLALPPTQTMMERRSVPIVVGGQSVAVYICGNCEPTDAGRTMLTEGLKWVQDVGYQLPAAVEVRDAPGGYHYFNGKMCEKFPVVGSAVKVGLVPERAACTARHELSHVIYAQQGPAMRQDVKALYERAMRADYGLIFNDEHYMVDRRFLHAGHPMQNASEFFAGALHAYSQHPDELMENINAPTTPQAVKDYARATLKLLDLILKK